ncbi:MAG: GspH/FimT family pseudopilin [Candidatus Binatia bacterium]
MLLPRTMVRERSTGFTLLELLCAIGVLSLLAATSLPRISAILPALALDRAARQIAAELALARVEAITRNTRSRTIFDLAAARYSVELESEGRFNGESAVRTLPAGVSFNSVASTRVSAGRISITFVPRGNTADNATIAVATASGGSRRVVVSAAGRVRVE